MRQQAPTGASLSECLGQGTARRVPWVEDDFIICLDGPVAKNRERPIRYHCDKVRVGDAGAKGRGVFANVAIKEREAIEVAPALQIPFSDVEKVGATFLSCYSFAHRDDYELIGLGYASMYNHSFDPNAQFVLMPRAVLITALRPIAEGEEISFDYGWSDAGFRAAGIEVPPRPP